MFRFLCQAKVELDEATVFVFLSMSEYPRENNTIPSLSYSSMV